MYAVNDDFCPSLLLKYRVGLTHSESGQWKVYRHKCFK